MARSQRLLALIQLLRGRRFPVAGATLAQELGISLRTLYRDIGALREQGAAIEGEAGLGYVLKPGFLLPPLMFTEEEIEAVVLGSRWVALRTDGELGVGARSALAKIAAVLPAHLRESLDSAALLIAPAPKTRILSDFMPDIRRAIREERKLSIRYLDLKEAESLRTVWPFALGYFDKVQLLAAWCELRQAFRHFRTDRILALKELPERFPRSRQSLFRQWREQEGIAEQ